MKKLWIVGFCAMLSVMFAGCDALKSSDGASVNQENAGAKENADDKKADDKKADDKKADSDEKAAKKAEREKRKAEKEAFRPIVEAYCKWEIDCKATGMEDMTLSQCVSAEMMGSRCIPQRKAYYECAVKTACDDQETCKDLSTAYGNCQVGKE